MYSSTENLAIDVSKKIFAGELDSALNLIVQFVEDIFRDELALANVFSSSDLDKICQRVGAEALKNEPEKGALPFNSNLTVYVASELYKTGGHTAALEDLIRAQPEKHHLILLTNIFQLENIDAIKDRFSSLKVDIEWSSEASLLSKLKWLQCQLQNKRPHQIFLFNHHQDAVIIAGIQPKLVQELLFYHHADHQLCLGVHLSYAKHIDPHAQGFYNCRNHLGVKDNIYLPLVASDLGERSLETPFCLDGCLRTCSSGSPNKFECNYAYSYSEEVPHILGITRGVHIHIGALSKNALSKIRQGLGERGIDPQCFIHVPWVRSLWKAILEQRVDVYLESFPLGGGRAAIEVMGSGTPIIAHQNYRSHMLSSFNLVYPEAFCWQKPDELHEYLRSLTPEILLKQAVCARQYYEQHHTPEALNHSLENINVKDYNLDPLPLKNYFSNRLQKFLDDANFYERQLTPVQAQLTSTQAQLTSVQAQLNTTNSQLEKAHEHISRMEGSKFWKLRKAWFQFAKSIGMYKPQ
jgi:hypothetical protein